MSEVIIGKTAIALAAAAAAFVAVRLQILQCLPRHSFDRLAVALLFVSRAGIAALIYGVLGQRPLSDVAVYATEGDAVLAGQVPFRDFFTAYSPLFPNIVAVILAAWNDPIAIVCTTIVIELFAFLLWIRIARHVSNEQVTRTAALLAALSPISMVAVPISGQNHVWLSAALAASLLCLIRGHVAASGLTFAVGIGLVKWLSIVFAPVLWCRSAWSWRWLHAACGTPVAIYAGWWYVSGGALAKNAAFHASEFSSGNLPFLLTALGLDLTAPLTGRLANLGLLIALAAVFLPAAIRCRRFNNWQCIHMLGAVMLTLLLLSKKAHPQYVLLALFPLTLSFAADGRATRRTLALLGFLAFSVVSAVESSLWYRWLDHRPLPAIFAPGGLQAFIDPGVAVFCLVEFALLASYAIGLGGLLSALMAPGTGTTVPDRV